jgi:hypothetical protein
MRYLTLVAIVLSVSVGTFSTRADAPAITARYALGATVPQLSLDGASLAQAVDYLRQMSGANIIVNWKVLEGVGVAKETPISIQVRNLPMGKMLQLVLDQASPNTQLVYTVHSNIVDVTTQDEADKKLYAKVYVVDDLLVVPPLKRPPNLSISQSNAAQLQIGSGAQQGTSNGTTGGSGQGLFGDSSNNQYNQGTQMQKTPAQQGEDLATLIRQVVRPSIWVENGGPASIHFFNGKLIVNAPASVHEMIGGPLDQ